MHWQKETFTSKKWLITGGCGFIGVNLVKKLLSINPKVGIRILDNLSVGTKDDLRKICSFKEVSSSEIKNGPSNVELVVGDIRDKDVCISSTKGIDIVVHLAANTGVAPSVEDPLSDMEVNIINIIGTFNMLEAARRNNVEKFIFASSGAPLGEVKPPIHEEIAPKPVSPYGASKLSGEAYCSAYYRTFGLNTIALRFGNVYGPYSKHKSSVVAKFFKRALSGQPLEIYGDGNQTRDFIYIDDLIQAILLSAKANKIGGEVFQIATFKETTVNEIAQKIKEIVEQKRRIKVKIIHTKPRVGDVKRNYSDISKAKKLLGYSPKYSLEKGLLKTFEYFLHEDTKNDK